MWPTKQDECGDGMAWLQQAGKHCAHAPRRRLLKDMEQLFEDGDGSALHQRLFLTPLAHSTSSGVCSIAGVCCRKRVLV